MGTDNKLDDFLKTCMSAEHSENPSPELVTKARAVVAARKQANETADLFYRLADFLNFRVKLSYAMVTLVFIGVASVYLIKSEPDPATRFSSPETVNIPSARSSTVLSSIITFETRR